MYKSEFLNEINLRGFVHQASDINALDELLTKKNITSYIGFDPTSDDLHVGSLVQLMLLNWMQHYNHKPIVLMGGGTGGRTSAIIDTTRFKIRTTKIETTNR